MNQISEYVISLETFDYMMHSISMIIFMIGMITTLIIFLKKRTVSSVFLIFLMIGGFLFTLGDVIQTFELWEEEIADDFGDSFTIFLASVILIVGLVVILEQKLKDSEEKFHDLFENSPFSIILLNLKGNIIDCNSETEILLKCKKDEIIGEKITEILIDHSNLEIISNVIRDYNIKREIHKPLELWKPQELQLFRKDGTAFWANLQVSLYKLNVETSAQLIIQDISERKSIETIIKKEIEKLKEIDQIRSDFVRRTSHELKTPLISIYSSTQYILDNFNKELNEDIVSLLETINRGGKRLKRLADNLLDVFNLETRILTLTKQKIDLAKIIKENVKDLSSGLKERNLFVKLTLSDSCYIFADSIRIEQVIMNLLSNAIKNTPPNGIIYISLNKQNDFVDIVFKDTGVGFTEVEKEKIFEKFGKIERKGIKNNIIIEGSGLGLYISKQIVELHGGIIWVESEGRNKGSTFTIRLPLDETKSFNP